MNITAQANGVEISSYSSAVAQNLAYMGTAAAEWAPVEIRRMATTKNDAGADVSMPEFDFPEGFKSAESMYRNTGAGEGMNCELCGHMIKNAFWLRNDTRRWLLLVGSECVTHFSGGDSGMRLDKSALWKANRELVERYRKFVSEFLRKNSIMKRSLWGNSYRTWSLYNGEWEYRRRLKLLGSYTADSSDRHVTSLVRRNGEAMLREMESKIG